MCYSTETFNLCTHHIHGLNAKRELAAHLPFTKTLDQILSL
uniref:Uncharacterized protein n=1 Tax=Arundo donax TaxID=35708 RepID=A0A0A9A9J4_ARUDO